MIVPIAFFFDANYLVPASVAITSLLTNSDPAHEYHIHVFHNGIAPHDIGTLAQGCTAFPNARFFSRDMENRFAELFARTRNQVHYSKEMYYKLLVPSLLPQYDRAIVSDVDVVFEGDVSKTFAAALLSPDSLVSASTVPIPHDSHLLRAMVSRYESVFDAEDVRKMTVAGGGYSVFNLDRMRREDIEAQLVRTARANAYRSRQPEQDAIALVCHSRMEILPINSMICTYCYRLFAEPGALEKVPGHSAEEIREALDNPVQLHFAQPAKPWNTAGCLREEVWFAYFATTPFFDAHVDRIIAKVGATPRLDPAALQDVIERVSAAGGARPPLDQVASRLRL